MFIHSTLKWLLFNTTILSQKPSKFSSITFIIGNTTAVSVIIIGKNETRLKIINVMFLQVLLLSLFGHKGSVLCMNQLFCMYILTICSSLEVSLWISYEILSLVVNANIPWRWQVRKYIFGNVMTSKFVHKTKWYKNVPPLNYYLISLQYLQVFVCHCGIVLHVNRRTWNRYEESIDGRHRYLMKF